MPETSLQHSCSASKGRSLLLGTKFHSTDRWLDGVCRRVCMVYVRWPHWRDSTNVWSCVFLDFKKVGKFAASIERPKAKNVSTSGKLRPLTPDPRNKLALRARHGLPSPLSNIFRGLWLQNCEWHQKSINSTTSSSLLQY